MHKIPFTKMNGAGNDFVMLDNRAGQFRLDASAIARLCDRHRGVGADGVLAVEAATRADTDFRMRYYNADGGEAEMCGNGARCFARFAGRLAARPLEQIAFETPAGVIRATFEGERVRLDMSAPRDFRAPTPLVAAGETLPVHFIDTGVPHAVVFADDVEKIDVHRLGAALRYHEHFAPRGTNANFVQILEPGRLVIRTYERGVEGETLACGTGAVASALIYAALHGVESPVDVRVRGGDDLRIGFARHAEGFENVTLSGPADFVFAGEIGI
jgi:diaminopimelate epimerase